eukprot:SAG22_NODE_10492_length_532_cov_0.773672_2_plen_25_part_01
MIVVRHCLSFFYAVLPLLSFLRQCL